MLDRRRAPLHSGDFFFPAFFSPPQTGFICQFIFSSFFTSKDYEHLFKKKKFKTKQRERE